jgi:WD40 repeat protein/transcriptional regulator with XRE-family HTH domain
MGEPSFGRQVRERRRALDLTQEELARRVGCAAITIRKIEAGALRASQQVAGRLAVSLGLPPDERPAFVRAARTVVPDGREPPPQSPPRLALHEVGAEHMGGQVIRGYQLGERIGAGGFGAVYRAIQPLVERDVAIKIILPHYADQPDFIRRFEAEAQLVAHLEHPHIVPLYDYWREPGVAYLVMRLMRGGELRQLLEHGPPPLELVLRMVEQLGAALHAAHAAGVVHRDLKPANVLLDEEGNAYLADFGIAKDLHHAAVLSMAGAFVGSPAYSSPEQVRAEPITPQTDIYAFGVLLYELLTGQRPFPGPTPASFLEQHVSANVPPLEAGRPGLPPALDRAIRRATAKIPAARFDDVAELVAEVQAALGVLTSVPFTPLATPMPAAPPTLVLDLPAADNPYRGLRLFTEADAATFFGRESLVQQLLTRLGEGGELARFLAVVGPSGSGKSSVVRAGLLPALRGGGLPGSEQWYVADLLPGAQPLEALVAALCRVAPAGVEPDDLRTLLRADERGLLRAARAVLPPDPATELLLVIDQFEELFTLADDEAAREHLLDSIVTAVLDERSRLRIVMTLRADFMDRPLQYVDFGELLRQRSELVLPLTAEETERAILGPARRVGLQLEDGLAAALVADGGGQPGALPLLQHTLSELYVRRQGRRLSRAAYTEIGGVAGGLASSAEACYTSLGAAGQLLARQIFLRLTTPGEGTEDTRRRTPLSEIQALGDQTDAVVRAFGDSRLLTFDRDPLSRTPTVEVAHEALLRAWPRLRGWLDGARADLRVQRRLAQAVAEWARAEQAPGYLAAGAWLAQYEALGAGSAVALTAAERDYLAASLAERERQAEAERERHQRELKQARALAEEQRQRAEEQGRSATQLRRRAIWLAGILGLALIAATLAGVLAGGNANLARANAESAATAQAAQAIAEMNFANGERLRLAAEATVVLNGDAPGDVAALLAIRSLRLGYSGAADAALLRALARLPRQRLSGHTGIIQAVAFSPDGRTVLTGGDDGTARLWDVATGHEIRQFVGHTGRVVAAAFSPDGRTVLTGGDDQTARLWDVATGQEIHQFVGNASSVGAVAFSPDGAYVLTANGDFDLTGGEDLVAHLWEVATGRELRQLKGHTAVVTAVAFSPDGRSILTASYDWSVRLWDAATGQELRQLHGHSDETYSVAFSPDGKTVLTSSNDRTARLWEVATGREIQRFNGHTHAVTQAVFAPDGTQVLTGSWDNTVRLWDVATGQELQRFTGHTQHVVSVAFAPDGRQIISGGFDQVALLWNPLPQLEPRTFAGHTNHVLSVAFSPDGTRIESGGRDNTARLWNAATGQQLRQFATENTIVNIQFSPDGTVIATTTFDVITQLWDVATGRELRRFTPAGNAAFSPDGRQLATVSGDHDVLLWDVASGQVIRRFVGHTAFGYSVIFSSDGTRLLTNADDRTARLWDVATGNELQRFTSPLEFVSFNTVAVSLSPDGPLVITAAGTIVQLWDAATGKELRRLAGHTDEVNMARFSPDSRYALTTSDDGTARVWDVATGQELRRLSGHAINVFAAAFSPDGTQILTGSFDTTLRLWRADLQEVIRLACAQLPRDLTDEERQRYTIVDSSPTCPAP